MEKKNQKNQMQFKMAVRLCVAVLGIGVGITMLWGEQWSGDTIWLPITLIAVSVIALVLFLRATGNKKEKNDTDKYEL